MSLTVESYKDALVSRWGNTKHMLEWELWEDREIFIKGVRSLLEWDDISFLAYKARIKGDVEYYLIRFILDEISGDVSSDGLFNAKKYLSQLSHMRDSDDVKKVYSFLNAIVGVLEWWEYKDMFDDIDINAVEFIMPGVVNDLMIQIWQRDEMREVA